ncbi:MAG TPA: hypothetical protein VE974_16295 [Thermoanaerobaculia bacterium]|nr:hypothetical protein [Thermoanaerobaculia bacterium]
MHPFGSDRVRASGERVILLSPFSKGWTARTPKSNTHAEYPGTTVLWDEQYFEVVEATAADGERVRYVLEPWREEHTIRQFEHYSEETEARRLADYDLARKQRRASTASSWSGLILGHLPEPAQRKLQNDLGITPSRITIISCIPPVVVFGVCIYLGVDAYIRGGKSPVPGWLFAIAAFMTLESFVRFHVAMQQGRGLGSVIGTAIYILYWYLTPNKAKLASPFNERGDALFTLPPPDDVAVRDALTLKGPILTLLSRREQEQLAERYGFDYRKHAYGLTWMMLVCSLLGAITSYVKVSAGAGASVLISMFLAAVVLLEQIVRLMQLQRGPAPSMFAPVVRPFARDLLR